MSEVSISKETLMKPTMRWIEAAEHTPEEGKLLLVYSEVHGAYFLAQWSACRGWLDQEDDSIRIITHWFDCDLPLVYPITNKIDEEAATRYGFKLRSGPFGFGG